MSETPELTRRRMARGIIMMAFAVGLLATMNFIIKLVGPDYNPVQAVFLRNLAAALVIVPIVLSTGGVRILKTKRPMGHAARSIAGVVGSACFFFAYQRIPLADGMSIALAVPIFATILAIPLLQEKVGWHRWSAVLVGFIGIIIALKPTGAFQPAALGALAGTVLWAFTIIFMRKLGETESPQTIVFYYMVSGCVMTALFLPWVWRDVPLPILGLFAVAGTLGALGQLAMTYALKLAPASVVSPLEYTQICWAVLFDMAVWGVAPSVSTVAGAALVIATGLYIYHREGGRRKH